MFTDLPTYEDRAAAGDWLEAVPSHWQWAPGRTLFWERKDSGHVDEEMLSVTIGRGVIPQRDLLASTSKKDSSNTDRSKYKLVLSNDLVYNKMRAWQGAAGVSRHRGIVSPAYIVMALRNGEPPFFHYLVRTPLFAKEAERWSYGITSDQWSLRPEHFKMIRFPVPPAEEQAAIVKYLAHATARIDKAIATKRRLLPLLDEQRRIIASELMLSQASQRLRLKDVTTIQTGLTLGKDYHDAEPELFPYLRVANVQAGFIDIADVAKVSVPVSEANRRTLRTGDVLMTEGGDIDKLGRGAVWRGEIEPCLHQNHVFAVRCGSRLLPEYLTFWLAGPEARDYFYLTAKQTTNLASTNSTTLRALPIAVPPISIQRRIIDRFEESNRPVDTLAFRTSDEIDLLREFRTRLIADVVTGRVDVRAIAASLPDVDPTVVWGTTEPGDESEDAELDDALATVGGDRDE